MKIHAENYRAFLQVGIYLLAIILILVAADFTFRLTLDNLRTIRLKEYSSDGLDKIASDIGALDNEVKAIGQRVNVLRNQTYPGLADIKKLSREFNVRLEKMERLNLSSDKFPGLNRYNTTFRGTVGGLIKLTRRLETDYIFASEYVILYPAIDDGRIVGLSMAILIDESES